MLQTGNYRQKFYCIKNHLSLETVYELLQFRGAFKVKIAKIYFFFWLLFFNSVYEKIKLKVFSVAYDHNFRKSQKKFIW